MPAVWRLTKTRLLGSAWTGEGARLYGGRWNSVGTRVVYCSEHLSLALLEVLVHLNVDSVLPAYSAIRAEFDDHLATTLDPAALPANWRDHPPPPEARAIGDEWVRAGPSLALRVPSVVTPSEFNYLLNPGHRDFPLLVIGRPMAYPFDARLLRRDQ